MLQNKQLIKQNTLERMSNMNEKPNRRKNIYKRRQG